MGLCHTIHIQYQGEDCRVGVPQARQATCIHGICSASSVYIPRFALVCAQQQLLTYLEDRQHQHLWITAAIMQAWLILSPL